MKGAHLRYFILLLLLLCRPALMAQQLEPNRIELAKDTNGLGVLALAKNASSKARNYIDSNRALGTVGLKYQDAAGKEMAVSTKAMKPAVVENSPARIRLSYELPGKFSLTQGFEKIGSAVLWEVKFANNSTDPITIRDLSLSLPFGQFTKSLPIEDNLSAHNAIIGNASFCYWVPYSGTGDILVMTMAGSTSLEFINRPGNEVYVHAAGAIDTLDDSWRIPATKLILPRKGTKTYGFKFEIAETVDAIREILYRNDGLDTKIAPGMTVPADLSVTCAFRTKALNKLIAEYPQQTEIAYIGPAPGNYKLYKLRFKKLGENMVTVDYGKGKKAYLNFFSTEPLESLIKKRSDFITHKQQVRDTSKWYDGLYGVWDMEQARLLTPDDKGPLPSFVVGGSDDPSNCKPLYVAEKNVVYPDKAEIAALEYYEKEFVWGGLQRRNDEYPYPYGIYGSENWFENRSGMIAGYNSGGWGKERMWRTFDYTTHLAIYYNLYKIARNDPSMVTYLNADGYLERAYRTAMAFFEIPYNIKMGEKWSFHGWTDWAYKQGNFHERYILEIIQALIENNRTEPADLLRREWEKKVKYFIYDDPWPFASEFEIDRTAFESTYYVAEYAKEHVMEPQEQLWYDKNKERWYSHLTISDSLTDVLMQKQLNANLALRGLLEPSFNLLGTAWSSTFSLDYMSQMAGVAILDYGLKFSDQPYKYVNIGYNSLLSSWALMNTGDQASNYGYWYPGKENDGAVGWVFTPWQKSTMYFENIPAKRGIWKYDGEIDHGLVGGIHGSSSIVVEDPVFGLTGYGCELKDDKAKGEIAVIPRDGIRKRLDVKVKDRSFSIKLEQDGFLKDQPIYYSSDLKTIRFSIENRQTKPHESQVLLAVLAPGRYQLYADGNPVKELEMGDARAKPQPVNVPVNNAVQSVIIKRVE